MIFAYVVKSNSLNFSIILLSIPFATLIASMILTNNIRDIEKDRHFRKTIAIYLGRKNAVSLLIGLIITDRKSTRLNSSHVAISYAVFCLKKKKKKIKE